MMLILLDSDCVIDLLKGINETHDLIAALRRRADTLCSCDVTVAEVIVGLIPRDRAAAMTLFDSLVFLPSTLAIGRQAAAWRYDYARLGVALSLPDCLVAATALEYDTSLVTGNLRDFPMAEVSIIPLPRSRRDGNPG